MTASGPPGARVERGARFDVSEPARLRAALDAIVDYRGDVTVVRRSGGAPLVGYVFDLAQRDDEARAALRLLPQDGGRPVTVPIDDIGALEVSGRDTAEGKSFEAWIRRYVEKRRAGEPANIEPETP